MTLLTWIIFGILILLTLFWFILVKRDSKAYVESQVKVLGEENRSYVDTKRMKLFLLLYALCLLLVLGFFFVYFLMLL